MSIHKLEEKKSVRNYVADINKESFFIEPAEVFDIILNEKHNDYIDDTSIGLIKFKRLFTDFKRNETDLYFAAPLNSYQKYIPVIHEIVMIVRAPTPETGIIDQATGFYYTNIVNVWRNVNHNALPYSAFSIKTKNKSNKNYTSFSGNIESSKKIKLGDYFEENIKRGDILPFEGDIIHQGRSGSSIRFSATYKKSKNPWSNRGENGDPIIIIRNDKQDIDTFFTIEDINKDASSIYICDGQLIPLEPAYFNLKSFKSKPNPPKDFADKQILINSGRLFFNASKESIFLSAKKSISISSEKTVNIDFKEKLIIGDEKKVEKTVMGETLNNFLNDLIDMFDTATIPSPMGPIPFKSTPQWTLFLTKWKSKLQQESLLSQKTFIE